jgi:hypothetical protein
VQVAQRWIVAALRHRKFFSLEELNVAIRELLDKLNHRPFRKRDGSRAESSLGSVMSMALKLKADIATLEDRVSDARVVGDHP